MIEPSEARDVLLNQLADEFAARQRAGQRPQIEEYCARHPDLADDIRSMFPALVELEQAKADAGAELAVEVVDAPPVTQLGDFRLLREVGRGGMGVVYEAEQVSLGRRVAIKLLPATLFRDPTKRRRFEREAKAAAKLHHTNIVPVHGFGEHDGTPYYVMQFIPGLGLDAVIDELGRSSGLVPESKNPPTGKHAALSAALARSLLEGSETGTASGNSAEGAAPTRTSAGTAPESPPFSRPDRGSSVSLSASGVHLPGQSGTGVPVTSGKKTTYWDSVARIGVQVAGALAYAHKQGVLHRDIKPANLLLDLDGIVWVSDFGLAKADDSDDLTHTGDLLGTLRYMPPEAFDGKSDLRSDVYALGLTLFELVALRPAYDEHDRNKLVKQVTTGAPPRLRKLRKDAPRDLVTIVEKAIDRNPARRYQSAGALADDLQRFLDGRPITARRATELERLWMWARRRPAMAGMVAALFLCLLTGSIVSTVFAVRAADSARDAVARERDATIARDAARRNAEDAARREGEAVAARNEANEARAASEKSRAAAQVESYHALLSEVRALRAGRPTGWRERALGDLARLAVMPTPRRDLPELRTEAAATLATPDVHLVARIELPESDLGSFTFSPDGRTLLTAGSRTGLDFWDVPGKRHQSFVKGLRVSDAGFDKVVYLPDGQGLVVGTRDEGVVFTDKHGTRASRAPITQGSSQPIKLALSANGQRLAVAWTAGGGITVHDVASGDLVERFKDSTTAFALSPDGKWLARQENSEIVLLPVTSSDPRIVLGRHDGVTALDFSPDGTVLAASFQNHTTVLWDVAKREQFGTLRGHRERVLDVAFSPDGGWVATASLDYTVRIWETRTGQSVASLPGSAPVRRVRWAPTGDYLATSTHHSSRDVFLYKITGRHRVQRWLTGHRVELLSVEPHPHLDRFATSGYTELISWDLSAPHPRPVAFEPNPGAVTAVAYSPDGSLLATASWLGANPREILIRDANSGKVRSRITGPHLVWALAFDPTGERLVSGDAAGNVVVWDVATGKPVQKFATGSTIRSIVYLDRPARLVTHGKDAVFLFDLESGKERKVEFPGGGIRRLVADRARGRVVVALQNGAVASLSLPELTPGQRFENAHTGSVECLALSPDGRLVVTGGADRRVVLRDATTFETVLEFPVWAGELRNLNFDSKGRRLAVVGTDSDVDLWDLTALCDGLVAVGLAWDRPAPAAPASGLAPEGEQLRPAAPVIRRPG